MPIYEFHCDQCGKDSEILVRSSQVGRDTVPGVRVNEADQEAVHVRVEQRRSWRGAGLHRTAALVRALWYGEGALALNGRK